MMNFYTALPLTIAMNNLIVFGFVGAVAKHQLNVYTKGLL